MKTTRIASTIASILACSLLAACGGGGGGMVRNAPAPTANPPAVNPNSGTTWTCPSTQDCVLDVPRTNKFLTQIASPHALVKQGPGGLLLGQGRYEFAKGVTIQAGFAGVHESTLRADVLVTPGASLLVGSGNVDGNVTNHGKVWLYDNSAIISGDLENRDVLKASESALIRGNFTQAANGTLWVALPPGGTDQATEYGTLHVGGSAHLGGTLQINELEYDRGWGELPLPAAGIGYHILKADGGVFGQFDRWTSPGLFIEGSLRYGSNDVWFDLTRISLQAAMAGQGFAGMTLASAGNLDRALAMADGFSTAPNRSQSRFLRSAGRLLWLDDAQQAARSLDSLAGSLHVDAMQALAQDDALARGIGARTLALQPGMEAGAWSRVQGSNTIAGIDQWLSPGLLVGATAAQARDARSDAMGGQSQNDSPQAALYLRWFGNDGWYAGGSAGYARHALALDRRIDLAAGGQWKAHAQRQLGIASLDAEAGRRFGVGGMTVAPYLWLGADAIRSEAAIEQGQTGFELTLQANTQASLDAGLGVRVDKRWSVGETGWLAVDADARYRQRLAQAGDPLRAAFIGVPDAWFDVPGHEARSGTWLDLGLRGGFGRGWAWSLGHAGSLAGQANGRQWQVGLVRTF